MKKEVIKENFEEIINDMQDVIGLIKSRFTSDIDVTVILTSHKAGTHNCLITTADNIDEVLESIAEVAAMHAAKFEGDSTKH